MVNTDTGSKFVGYSRRVFGVLVFLVGATSQLADMAGVPALDVSALVPFIEELGSLVVAAVGALFAVWSFVRPDNVRKSLNPLDLPIWLSKLLNDGGPKGPAAAAMVLLSLPFLSGCLTFDQDGFTNLAEAHLEQAPSELTELECKRLHAGADALKDDDGDAKVWKGPVFGKARGVQSQGKLFRGMGKICDRVLEGKQAGAVDPEREAAFMDAVTDLWMSGYGFIEED